MKMWNACNPILDTFRTISRCGAKLQTAPIVAIVVIVQQARAPSSTNPISQPSLMSDKS